MRILKDYCHIYSISKSTKIDNHACLNDYLLIKINIPPNDNTKTTQESTYIKENVSEINDIVELPEGIYFL